MTRYWIAIFALLAVGITFGDAVAAPFTPGNLAIYRVDAIGTNNSQEPAQVFIDEYTPTGSLVQSIPLPTLASGAQRALVAQDDADLEGLLNRSTDGQYLVLTGYDHNLGDAVPGGTTLAQSDASNVPRTIGRIDFDGTIDTTTTYSDSGAGSPRSAISDNGTNFWISQGSVGGGTDGGVRFTTLGSTGASTSVSQDSTDTRHIDIFGGQLYVSSATTGLNGILSVDTTAGTMTGLNAIPGGVSATNTVQIFMADLSAEVEGIDTAYVADTRGQNAQPNDGGGVHKYSLVDDLWIATGGIHGPQPPNPHVSALRGLTGAVDEFGTVTLYGTRNAGTNDGELLKFVDDSGYNGTMSGAATLLASVTDMYFKGIDFAPVAAPDLLGDHNGDGSVDAADYVVWRKHNTGGPQGYDDWVANFGATSGGSGAVHANTAVPEPAALGLLAIAALVVLACVRGRRSPHCAPVTVR
jgi:hypothetical protein